MGIYEEFGVTPIINASGAVTRLGGAPMPKELLKAFNEAASASVPLEQLQAAASRAIVKATETEAGLVTSGAASALTLGAAAILTGYDLSKMERLPHCEEFPNEFVVAREQRNGYDHAVRAAGARLIEIGFNEIVANAGVRRTETWEYEAAFGPNTAGVVTMLTHGRNVTANRTERLFMFTVPIPDPRLRKWSMSHISVDCQCWWMQRVNCPHEATSNRFQPQGPIWWPSVVGRRFAVLS